MHNTGLHSGQGLLFQEYLGNSDHGQRNQTVGPDPIIYLGFPVLITSFGWRTHVYNVLTRGVETHVEIQHVYNVINPMCMHKSGNHPEIMQVYDNRVKSIIIRCPTYSYKSFNFKKSDSSLCSYNSQGWDTLRGGRAQLGRGWAGGRWDMWTRGISNLGQT